MFLYCHVVLQVVSESNDNRVDSGITVHTREIGKIEPGIFVTASYHPTRGEYGPRDRSGTVESVGRTEDGRVRFVFYDEAEERDIKVTLGPTVGDCSIRSRKDSRWTTLGTPLRIGAHEDGESIGDVVGEKARKAFQGRYESVIAAAAVQWNERILEWYDWSKENA
jgi:hypothetical protein